MVNDTQMLTPKEVSEILGIHTKTVHLWLRTGKLDGIKISYRAWRIPRAALAGFIERNSNTRTGNQATPPAGNSTTRGEIQEHGKGSMQQTIVPAGNAPETTPSTMKQYIREIMGAGQTENGNSRMQ
jgi:excisionase family DNA binding protein